MFLKRNPKTGYNTDLYGSLKDPYPLAKLKTHAPEACEGRGCPIHQPSLHHMRDFPLLWRMDRGIAERICPHGVGHPDPDQIRYWGILVERNEMTREQADAETVHGCDFCCEVPSD